MLNLIFSSASKSVLIVSAASRMLVPCTDFVIEGTTTFRSTYAAPRGQAFRLFKYINQDDKSGAEDNTVYFMDKP